MAIFDKEIETLVRKNLKNKKFEKLAVFNRQKKNDLKCEKVKENYILEGFAVVTSQIISGQKWECKKIGASESYFFHDESEDVQINTRGEGQDHFYNWSGDWEYNTIAKKGNVYRCLEWCRGGWREIDRVVCIN